MDNHQQDENNITENNRQLDQPILEQNIQQDNEINEENNDFNDEENNDFNDEENNDYFNDEENNDYFNDEENELDQIYINYRNYLSNRYHIYDVIIEEFGSDESLVNMLLRIHSNNLYGNTEERDQNLLNDALNRSLEDDIQYTDVDMSRELDIEEKEYVENKTEEKCMVCLEIFQEKDIVANIDCNHVFHIGCLQEWGKRNPKCPLCKNVLPILTQERKRRRTE